jgi:lysophospholipase L1-like esterase
MRTLLCFGDSNTWGFVPATGARFDAQTRWAGVLRAALAPDWWVIEEGLNGRTTVLDDPFEPGRCGRDYLMPCLRSHMPLDAVILMLGTNDLKLRFHLPASDIARGAAFLADLILRSDTGLQGTAPALILMSPPPLAPVDGTPFADMFAGAEEKSRQLAAHYRQQAELLGCHFVDAGSVIVPSPVDAIHFEAEEHRKLGHHLADFVRRHLG